jgi:hypothetical protein
LTIEAEFQKILAHSRSGMTITTGAGDLQRVAGLEPEREAPRSANPDLWFDTGDHRARVPEWATGFVELGHATARSRSPSSRLVVAVAVPTRAYASVLVAAGAVAADIGASHTLVPGEAELEEHYQQLRSLRPGTTVTAGRNQAVAVFVGVDESGTEPLIVLRDTRKDMIRKFPKRGCHLLSVRGRRLSALVVGRLNVLEREITGSDLCDPQGHPLQQLLKVQRYRQRGEKEFRTEVLAASGELPDDLDAAQPRIVVFDGTAGFRHWKESWRGAAWVVVLDRTSAGFEEGVALIEEEYVQRATMEAAPRVPVPHGAEVMGFWTAR